MPGGARILLVDDDRAMLVALEEMVVACGHTPLTAQTWSEALRLYRQAKPDLVLLDVMMPDIDGFKMARILKNEEAAGFVPVILLTGLDDLESKRRGMASGADDFLTKPVSRVELEIRLQSMLRIKELTDQIRSANDKLAELAATDPLTGLRNRRAIYEHLEREFARSKRYRHPLAVFMLDLDHFKSVNDTYGHHIGDAVLRIVADTLQGCVRETDLVGRYGGEEFIILAPETSSKDGRIVGERVRNTVAARTAAAEGVPEITTSVGVATTESLGVSEFEDLVHAADAALYEAKDGGRNRIVVAR